jgi:ERCC4-type nuclease
MAEKTEKLPFQLPAVRSLGEHPCRQPVIVIDSREQTPLLFTRLPFVTETLQTGDYSVRGLEELFAVERKTIGDLVGCCMGDGRRRFEAELHRLRGYCFKRLLIVGPESDILTGKYHSNIRAASVLASLTAFEVRYDCPVVFCATASRAAIQIERWAFYYAREAVETVNDLCRAIDTTKC